jgi:hypothetical protein
MGIPVYGPYLTPHIAHNTTFRKSRFVVQGFELTTVDGRWTHTNADGTECPCYGFLITHKEMGKLLYITDTELSAFFGIYYCFKKSNFLVMVP